MGRPSSRHRSAAGLTLTELLVAVAIIVVLGAVGLLAMGTARRAAADTQCLIRLGQVGSALFAYSTDHQSLIPPRILPEGSIPDAHRYWHRALRHLGYLNTPLVNARSTSIHYCPSFTYHTNNLDYGTNDQAYGLRRWHAPGQPWDTSQKLISLERPAEFFLLVDSYQAINQEQGYFVRGGDPTWRIRLTHGGKAHTLFADGHVAAMPRNYFESIHLTQEAYTEAKEYKVWPENP